jgi:hypothetical protein
MNHLYFLVAWNKNKEKTWSGTCWGLFKALKKYFSVEDIDINLSKFENLVGKIKRRLFHRDNLFGLNDILKQRKKVRKILNTDKKSIGKIIYHRYKLADDRRDRHRKQCPADGHSFKKLDFCVLHSTDTFLICSPKASAFRVHCFSSNI